MTIEEARQKFIDFQSKLDALCKAEGVTIASWDDTGIAVTFEDENNKTWQCDLDEIGNDDD